MQKLNPRQVEAFRGVMLTGSTIAAANLLNVTQPAISRMLRDLQETLNLTLFERRGTRLLPTNEALTLYTEVERSFVGLDRIMQAAIELRSRRAGMLRIAALPALANGFLPRFAGHFLLHRPKLDLFLSGLISPAVLDLTASGQCDLGFAAVPLQHQALIVEQMPAARCMAVVPADHRLAKKRVLRPKDFADQPFIAAGRSNASRHLIESSFAQENVYPLIRAETPLSEIACGMVSSGLGLTICEPFTAFEYLHRGIAVRPFEPAIEFQWAALYPAQRTLAPVLREFVDELIAHVKHFMHEHGS